MNERPRENESGSGRNLFSLRRRARAHARRRWVFSWEQSSEEKADARVELSGNRDKIGERDVVVSTLDVAEVAGRQVAGSRELCPRKMFPLPAFANPPADFFVNCLCRLGPSAARSPGFWGIPGHGDNLIAQGAAVVYNNRYR